MQIASTPPTEVEYRELIIIMTSVHPFSASAHWCRETWLFLVASAVFSMTAMKVLKSTLKCHFCILHWWDDKVTSATKTLTKGFQVTAAVQERWDFSESWHIGGPRYRLLSIKSKISLWQSLNARDGWINSQKKQYKLIPNTVLSIQYDQYAFQVRSGSWHIKTLLCCCVQRSVSICINMRSILDLFQGTTKYSMMRDPWNALEIKFHHLESWYGKPSLAAFGYWMLK